MTPIKLSTEPGGASRDASTWDAWFYEWQDTEVVLYWCFHAALTHFTPLCHCHTTYKVMEGVKSNKSHDLIIKFKSADEFLF